MIECAECSGTGDCYVCNVIGFDPDNEDENCDECQGSGLCPDCGGEGGW